MNVLEPVHAISTGNLLVHIIPMLFYVDFGAIGHLSQNIALRFPWLLILCTRTAYHSFGSVGVKLASFSLSILSKPKLLDQTSAFIERLISNRSNQPSNKCYTSWKRSLPNWTYRTYLYLKNQSDRIIT